MRNLKKVLALVIAFSMMLSAVAFAGYKDVAADADYAGAVELLSALGIFEGDETGNFNPDKTVSRAEMAAIICRAMGVDTAEQAATKFSDVPASHWASGYIAYASAGDSPILNGVGGGKFNPSGTLTYQQALKIVVYALGFEPMANDNGGWSAGSIYVANRYKITEGADTTATRGNLAVILANAMSTPMMDKTSYGSDSKSEVLNGKDDKEYRTLLTDMDIYIATGVVGAKDEDEIAFEITEDSDDGEFEIPSGKKTLDKNFKIGSSDIAAYQYQNVDAYVQKVGKKYEVIAVVANDAGDTLTILSDDVAGYESGKLEYYVDAANSNKTKKFAVASDIPVEYNKDAATKETLETLIKDEDVVLTFIDNTSDGDYDQLVATKYVSTIVEYVDANRDKIGYEGKTFSIDFEDEAATIILTDVNGNALTLADFAEDDVVAVITDASKITTYNKYIEIVKLSDATVTGRVDSTWEDNKGVEYVVINGNEYINAGKTLVAGDEGTFYIGMTGKIIEFEVSTENLNYGLILEAAYASSAFTKTWQVRMLTADGVADFEVDEDLVKASDVVETDLKDSTLGKIVSALKAYADKELAWKDVDADPDVEDYEIAKRFVKFETNKNGQIDEIAVADKNAGTLDAIAADSEYRASSNRINGKTLADNVLVMYVDRADAQDVFAADVNFLVDETVYGGYIFKDNAHKENSVMIITEGASPFKAEAGFAIVTKTADSKNEDGEKVKEVSYVQGEVEGTLIFEKDTAETEGTSEYDELDLGDIFMFNANAEGVVSNYLVVAQYVEFNTDDDETTDTEKKNNYYNFAIESGIAKSYADGKFGDDAEISVGYIKDLDKKTLIVNADGKDREFDVDANVNQYTYDNFGRNTKIVVGDYMATNNTEAWANAEDQTKVTPVIFVAIDNELVDIYSANDKLAKTLFEGK